MSLGSRATTKGGAKTAKDTGKHLQDKKADKPLPKDKTKTQDRGKGGEKSQPKEKAKPQATTEQLRMAHMIDRKNEDSTDVRRMVLELMEMTCRTEEEVCSALHDADNDMQTACDLLLEDTQRLQGEWQTKGEKKKKKPPAALGNGDVEPPRDPRSRSGPRPRRGAGETGGRGRARGALRGRGRGGAPRGRRAPNADLPHGQAQTGGADSFPAAEDWDNEEWSGSLADTKVFTPSAGPALQAPPDAEEWGEPEPELAPMVPSYTYHNTNHAPPPHAQPLATPVIPSVATPTSAGMAEPVDAYRQHQPMGMSGSLSAAQSQYLSQLTQQSQRHDNSVYTSNYGVYGATEIPSQRKPQRARVPPPSKIPSSAVEMPGGTESGGMFDVQFGALEPDVLHDDQVPSSDVPSSHDPADATSYANSNSMLSENLSVETTAASQTVASEPSVTNSNTLESQLSASMKQLKVAPPEPSLEPPRGVAANANAQPPRAKPAAAVTTASQSSQNVYAPTQLYQPNVYAPQQPQVTTTVAPAAMSRPVYPPSATLSQYQPMINSYQQQSSSLGSAYGSALHSAAPYSTYTHKPHKDTTPQYDSAVSTSNSLTNTSTTQTTSAKVTTTASSGSAGSASAAYVAAPLYAQGQTYPPYEDHLLRHHMAGGYYEVGYGVSGAREGTFGLGAGERFGRADAASPQQVPTALPPGYAYFYQPPPTTYQYGVYPTAYGTGSNVGAVSGVSAGAKVSYTQHQPYDTQDTYKQPAAGAYTGAGTKAGAASGTDLTSAMHAYKSHVQHNKLTNYEKAAFHGGTPPPFGATSHHMFIPAAPHHHHHHHHQESGGSGVGGVGAAAASARPQQPKPYSQSYWPNN